MSMRDRKLSSPLSRSWRLIHGRPQPDFRSLGVQRADKCRHKPTKGDKRAGIMPPNESPAGGFKFSGKPVFKSAEAYLSVFTRVLSHLAQAKRARPSGIPHGAICIPPGMSKNFLPHEQTTTDWSFGKKLRRLSRLVRFLPVMDQLQLMQGHDLVHRRRSY
jgi:hypothetical protein